MYNVKEFTVTNKAFEIDEHSDVFIGVSNRPAGTVSYINYEKEYAFGLIELTDTLDFSISGFINNHPEIPGSVVRILPGKERVEPYKFIAVLVER